MPSIRKQAWFDDPLNDVLKRNLNSILIVRWAWATKYVYGINVMQSECNLQKSFNWLIKSKHKIFYWF